MRFNEKGERLSGFGIWFDVNGGGYYAPGQFYRYSYQHKGDGHGDSYRANDGSGNGNGNGMSRYHEEGTEPYKTTDAISLLAGLK